MAARAPSKTVSLDVETKLSKNPSEVNLGKDEAKTPGDKDSRAARRNTGESPDKGVKAKFTSQRLVDQLHDAVRDADLDLIAFLITKKNADVNQYGEFGDTALHWAVLGGMPAHDRIVQKLVSDYNADVNRVSKKDFTDDHTPLHLAASKGSDKCLRHLLNGKEPLPLFNKQTSCGETPLHKAAMAGRDSNVKRLLEMGADIAVEDKYGNTALHHGAYSGDHGVVRRLMEAGASRNKKNLLFETPTMRAKTPGIEQLIVELSPDREDFYQDGDDDS